MNYFVLAIELDTGPIFLSDRPGTLGLDHLTPAILSAISASADGCTVDLEAQALPPETIGCYWSNRDAAVIEVDSTMGSVYDGRIVFDGVISAEPSEQAGVFNLSLASRQHRVITLPNAAPIDITTWPKASAEAVGQIPPTIFGKVDGCELLAVEQQTATTLTEAASVGAITLTLDSTEGMPAYGAVWVGEESIIYNGISGNQLVGLVTRATHPQGSPVVLAGPAKYLPADHSVGIVSLSSNQQPITGYTLNAGLLEFSRRPLVNAVGQAMNVMAQFDQVATGAWLAKYDVAYQAGRTIESPGRAQSQVTTQAAAATTAPVVTSASGSIAPACTISNVVVGQVNTVDAMTTTWTVSVAVTGSLAIPSGAAVSVASSVEYASVTIGEQPLRRSLQLSSNGSVSMGGTLSFVVRYARGYSDNNPGLPQSLVISEVTAALKQGNTLEQARQYILGAFMRYGVATYSRDFPWNQVAALSPAIPAISLSWKTTTAGVTLPAPPPVTVTTPARESVSAPTLNDLAISIVPPQSITSGTFAFTVDVASQMRQDITNPAPVYTATLGGVSFAVPKAGGTVVVNVPVVAGVPVSLIHDLTHAVDMDATLVSLFGETLLDEEDKAEASAINLIVPQIRNVTVTWSNASITGAALNPGNAIRYATPQSVQPATGWDTSIATGGTGNIVFSRPSADRIINSYTTVNFTVNLNGHTGTVGLSIGGQNVYYAEGGNAQYNWSPCTIEGSEDVDLVPVELTGGTGIVTVTINSASRTVLTGNIDGGKYATLRHPSNTKFRAVQIDQMPPRGRFKKARLFVEWFMGGIKGAAVPDVKVSFGGKQRGSLNLVAPAGSTVNKTVTVDSASAGAVAIPSLYVPQAVSGAVGALAHSSIPQTAVISPIMINASAELGSTIQRGWAKCPKFQGLTGNIVVRANFVAPTLADVTDGFLTAHIRRSDNTNIAALVNTASLTNIATSTYQVSVTIAEAPDHIFCERIFSSGLVSLSSITFEWNASIASTSVTQTNNLTVGSQGGTGATNTGGPAVSVTLGNNAISVTVPDAPRTTVTEFALAEITDWSQLTGQVCEIEYTAGVSTLDINLVQVQIACDYEEANQTVVGGNNPLIATLHGSSGNPADVIGYLASVTGQMLDPIATRRLRTWCETKGYAFARRLSAPTDSLTLLTYAAEQSNVQLARRGNTIAPVRWFDMSSDVMTIPEEDCLQAAQIGWADRVETSITLNYREDVSGNSGFTRTRVANSSNNKHCRRGRAAIRFDNAVTIEAGWIRDDTTAALYLADTARRYGQPRRVLSLQLPHTYCALQEGDLIRFTRLNQGIADSITARITTVGSDAGWPSITAEQIND